MFAALTGEPAKLSLEAALKILPIAHQYNMVGLLCSCARVLEETELLGFMPPSTAEDAQQHPALIQWLSLKDAKQCSPEVQACLSQLRGQDALPVLRSALSSKQSRKDIGQLCSSTLMELLNVTFGLPLGFKVIKWHQFSVWAF